MVNNLILRIISAVILGGISIFSIIKGGILLKSLLVISLFAMIFEWTSINKKKNLLYFSGLIYIIIPMIFWIFNPNSINILWAFTIVWSCDIFAYFGGRLIGGPKFAPTISPKKTWAGVIVGSFFAFISSYFYILKFMNMSKGLLISSIFMIIASVYGDLLESKAKRILDVKDSGNIIPGHGGVCDRLDSFLLVSYIFMIIYYFGIL